MRALGCHVFAGGFTMGVRQRADVLGQLEIHDFGRDTVEAMCVPFFNASRWEDWPEMQCEMLYGNPRCTGFSTMTSGYDDTIHGPFAKCTQDIRDLCAYGVKQGVPIVCWESVQQAYSVGRPLIDLLRDETFLPNGYRVAHLFLNAAGFGNAQRRKRYFFIAYKRGRNFNIVPPRMPERQTSVRDVIGHLECRETHEVAIGACEARYDADCYNRLCAEDKVVVPHLREKEDFNGLARRTGMEGISDKYEFAWHARGSDIPFSLHCPTRIAYDRHCPTLSSSCCNFIHPKLDRPLTVREMSALMGWPDGIVPRGRNPAAQIAKGICPEIGVWLAEQAQRYVDDAWGREDWDARWNGQQWVGDDFSGQIAPPDEKVFNLTHFAPEELEWNATAA